MAAPLYCLDFPGKVTADEKAYKDARLRACIPTGQTIRLE